MSDEEEKLSEEQKSIARFAVQEFMRQVYQGVGKGLIERAFWLIAGVLIAAYFGGHLPK